jgi:DNA-binding LacI/PurR family transcriptional regulator
MGESAFYVDVDMQGVGFQAADFFLGKGYKRILYINLPEFMLQSKQRREGFVLAYKKRGLQWSDSDHIFLPISAERCCEAVMERFLTAQPYQAIVTSNELQAQGVIRAMKELRIDIPGKLELSSMGGTLLGTLTVPTLTTIDFDSHKNGYEAAQMLLDILGKKRIVPFHLILPGHFVERGSTK